MEAERKRCRELTLARDQAAEEAAQRVAAAEGAAQAAKKAAEDAGAQQAAAQARVAALEEQLQQADSKVSGHHQWTLWQGGWSTGLRALNKLK